MPDTFARLEQRLIAGYGQQASQYELALRILEERASAATGTSDDHGWASALQGVLQSVTELDADLADDKVAWRQSGRVAGADLRLVLDRVATQIRVLGERIDGQVADLVARKQRLLPEIDEFIRQRWMLNAYGRVGQAATT
jgi:hypothetical protein